MMRDEDPLCLCFHVSKRKVVNYIRLHRPKVASQLSECYGAGTGCGWCRPFLRKLMEDAQPDEVALPSPDEYAAQRQQYRDQQKP